MTRHCKVALLATSTFAFPARAVAQPNVVPVTRETSAPPARSPAMFGSAARAAQASVLDGRDNDDVWKSARVIDQFLEYEPNTGAVPRFRTEVRVLYDDTYPYILGRMHDPRPTASSRCTRVAISVPKANSSS